MENKTPNVVNATTQSNALVENIQLKNGVISKKELQFMLQQTFPTLTAQDYFYAVSQCKAYGLDPRTKEIYFVPFNGKAGNSIASITSYEVYARELENAGYDFVCEWMGDQDPTKPTQLMCKAKIVYKNTGNVRYVTPWISIKEYAKMDYKKAELSGMWKQFPSLMLEKCILVRCCRFVLGKNLGYTAEELYNAKQYDIEGAIKNKAPEQMEPQERVANVEVKPNYSELVKNYQPK